MIAAGRVGKAPAFLFREGELYHFFENPKGAEDDSGFVGSNSLVSVELASIPIEPHDIIVVFSEAISREQEARVREALVGAKNSLFEVHQQLLGDLFGERVDEIGFSMCTSLGPETVLLTEVISDEEYEEFD